MRYVYPLVILFCAGYAEELGFQNNHYNIRHGKLTYVRPPTQLPVYRNQNSTYANQTQHLSKTKNILEPKNNDTHDNKIEFRVGFIARPFMTTVRAIPPGRLKTQTKPEEEQPVVREEPVAEQQPVLQEEPVVVQQPVVQEEAVAVQQPVVQEEAVAVQQPVLQEEPVAVKQPVFHEEPVSVQQPVVQEEPVAVQQPVVQEEPVAVQQLEDHDPVELEKVPKILKNNSKVCYDEAILMRAHLTGLEDLLFMKKLQRSNDIQIWGAGAYFMDFLVHRAKRTIVEAKLKGRHENYTCLISNLKPVINTQRYERAVAARKNALMKIEFNKYVSLETIESLFELLSTNYAPHTEFRTIGTSYEGRDIWALRVNKNNSNNAIVVVGGIHGRDWASVTSILSVLKYLMLEESDQKYEYFDSLDWYFIPVLNPDGYQHTRFMDRFWSKNRNPMDKCVGVDLASNFGMHWDTNPILKPSQDSCSEDYPGPAAFSETETRALRDLILTLQKKEKVIGFVDVQSYGQTITFPWGGDKKMSSDGEMHSAFAQGMRKNIYSRTKMHFTFGPSYDIPYPRSGLSIDWAYSVGITHSYIIETRDTSKYGYLLPHSQIEAAGTDIVQALKSLTRKINPN